MFRFRRFFAFTFPIIFIVAIFILAASETRNPVILAASLITGLGTLFQFSFTLWDRYLPDKYYAPIPHKPATEKMYLEGRLREFEHEEQFFVGLAGNIIIKSRFDSYDYEREKSSVIAVPVKLGKGNTRSLYELLASSKHEPRRLILPSEPEPVDIMSAVKKFNQFVIVGEPGSGKSTTLRAVATNLTRQYLAANGENLALPLWINLGLSENPVHLEELLQYWWNNVYFLEGDPQVYWQHNKLWLFLDGLNEIPEYRGKRKEKVAELQRFLKAHPHIHAIVTCRTQDYKELNLALPVVRIYPLDEERIKELIQKRLGSTSLWATIRVSDALRRMSSNPYTLMMLIELYERRGQLPINLNDLYSMFLQERHKDYFAHKKVRLSWKKLDQKLQNLAFMLIIERKGTSADLDWAQRLIGRRALQDGFDLGVLLQDFHHVRFFHQSLQGYFAIPGLERVLRHNFILTVDIGDLGELATFAIPVLIPNLKDKEYIVRMATATTLGKIGSSEAVPALIDALNDEYEDVQERAAEALGLIGSDQSVPALINALENKNETLIWEAAWALGQIGNLAAVPALIKTLKDKAEGVRWVSALALGWIGNSEAVPALSEALKDEEEGVRNAAIGALENINSPEAQEVIFQWHLEQNQENSDSAH